MIADAAGALGVLALVIATGLPAAALLARRWERIGLAETAAVAATVGVSVHVLAGIAVDRLWTYRLSTMAVVVGTFVLATLAAAWKARSSLRPPTTDPTSLLLLGLTVLAVPVAGESSYFLFQTGDMGSYVNAANILADGDGLGSGFPHGFIVWLANAHLLAGQAAMVSAAMLAIGALFVLVVSALVRRLTGSRAASVVVAVLLLVHPTPRWFTSLPVSEALFFVVLAGAFLLLVHARRSADVATAVAAGAVASLLLVVRANALVLAIVVVVGAGVSFVADDRRTRTAQAAFNATATFGLFLAYAYNVASIPAYFVESQLAVELPGPVFRALDRLDLVRVSPTLVAAGALATAAVLGISLLGRPPAGAGEPAGHGWLTPLVTVSVSVVTVAVVGLLGADSIVDALPRWGVLVLVLSVLGLVATASGRVLRDPVVVAMALATASLGLVLYAIRLDEPRVHSYYLYWDRYLFADSFLFAVVLAGVAVAAVLPLVDRFGGRRRTIAGGALAVVAVAAGAATVPPLVEESAAISDHRLLGDAYGALEAIADVVALDGSEPVVFTGPDVPPAGWFFPNTFRAYAVPLSQTFGVRVVNIPVEAFATDPSVSVREARRRILAAADDSGTDVDFGYLLRVRGADQPAPDLGPRADLVRTVRHRVWSLPRLLDGEEDFGAIDIVLELHRVDVPDRTAGAAGSGGRLTSEP